MKRIYYLVSAEEFRHYSPVGTMLSEFSASDYAHNIRMYSTNKKRTINVFELPKGYFDVAPVGHKMYIILIDASETYIEFLKKYLFDGGWEKRKVKPYLEFARDEDGTVIPIEWFDEEFKELFM